MRGTAWIYLNKIRNLCNSSLTLMCIFTLVSCGGGGSSSSSSVSPSNAILSYSINNISGVINTSVTPATISITLPFGMGTSGLIASFVTNGASVTAGNTTSGVTPQTSGVTPNTFPVTYNVTGSDGATAQYLATVYTTQVLNSPRVIAFSPDGSTAFIANSANSTITSCSVNNGNFNNCINSGATLLTTPLSITLNSAGTLAYIANTTSITICQVSGGLLPYCYDSQVASSMLSTPTDIDFDPTGTWAFITNSGNNSLTICTESGDKGYLTSCVSNTTLNLASPQSITLNSAGTVAYITNTTSLTSCNLSESTFSNCGNSGATSLTSARGMVLNPAETLGFIISGTNAIRVCNLNGLIASSCYDSQTPTSFLSTPIGIVFNAAGTQAFITNSGNSTLVSCSVSSTGIFSNCAYKGTPGST